ncbi:MAG: PIG-L family deacetylase [Defluviitaleaceae bacterium]|nr:PIG-L family deacetylase [Defluviitaleaceae bacterium]
MKLTNTKAEVFIPSKIDPNAALVQTTDLCIAAHHDDIEIMAYHAIAECFGSTNRHFTGVVVTDGGGSLRSGVYADHTDEDMKAIRATEQKTAACIGRYSAQLLLAYPSSEVKDPNNRAVVDELKDIILVCSPEVLYMHNLADKHDTHVALALRTIEALREIDINARPKRVVAMEVWRGLDWLRDEDKAVFDTSAYPNLSAALISLFDSQISSGKRYDLAIQGRRLANATFFASHAEDHLNSAAFGLDITDLVNSNVNPADFIATYIDKFKNEVSARIAKFS